MSRIREDQFGIYIRLNGSRHRPGDVTGYSHAYDMDAGGLKTGDSVKAVNVGQSPLIKITLDNGRVLRWCASRPGMGTP